MAFVVARPRVLFPWVALCASLTPGCGDGADTIATPVANNDPVAEPGVGTPNVELMTPPAQADPMQGPLPTMDDMADSVVQPTPPEVAPVPEAEPELDDDLSDQPPPAALMPPGDDSMMPEGPMIAEPAPEPASPAAVNCTGIDDAGFELCEAGDDFCTAVFSGGQGCDAVCAAAGLSCVEAWEDLTNQCSADTNLGMVDCNSGHMSDYCVCAADGEAPSTTPDQGPRPEPEPESQPEPEQPDIGPKSCGCDPPAGESGSQVSSTIVVGSGQVYDGECKIFRANPGSLGDGSQAEGQSPVFRVNAGGTLRNVVLGASAADGIHVYGNATLENVHWLDIGEDALTIKESGTVNIDCGSAQDGEDKVFQINAAAEIHISNFTARNAGKFMRQNGGTTFQMDVFIDHCDISDMDEVIFRTDSGSSHVTLTNTRYSRLGKGLFMFGSNVVNGDSGQSTVSNNMQY